eukprot:UC4_evm1s921
MLAEPDASLLSLLSPAANAIPVIVTSDENQSKYWIYSSMSIAARGLRLKPKQVENAVHGRVKIFGYSIHRTVNYTFIPLDPTLARVNSPL